MLVSEAGALERPLPRLGREMSILSPFDNAVIQRDRLRTFFDFDYQIECYVTEAKRRYGYFCLPLLYRDTFVGRMDCKAHRKDGLLEIKTLHLEEHSFDEEAVLKALAKAVKEFLIFQGCDEVSVTKVFPKKMAGPVRRVLG